MKFKNWTPEKLAEWAKLLPSSSLMNHRNKIKLWGEIHCDNSEPKDGSEVEVWEERREGE